jgi:NADH-quinone oxidoreductase subunit D
VENIPAGPVERRPERQAHHPGQEATYRSIEGLIQHFELFMWNRRWETPVDEVYGATEAANGELGYYVVADGGGKPFRARDPAAVVHPLRVLPADDGGAPDLDVPAVLGQPEHHRRRAGPVTRRRHDAGTSDSTADCVAVRLLDRVP